MFVAQLLGSAPSRKLPSHHLKLTDELRFDIFQGQGQQWPSKRTSQTNAPFDTAQLYTAAYMQKITVTSHCSTLLHTVIRGDLVQPVEDDVSHNVDARERHAAPCAAT